MDDDAIPQRFRHIPAELLQTLMKVGFYACGHGKPTAALKIFRGVAAVRPRSPWPSVGEAMALLVMGCREEACEVLVSRALALDPENQLVLAFIGMIYRLANRRRESDAILSYVLHKNSDPDAVKMAREILQEDDPSPAVVTLDRGKLSYVVS